MHGFAERKGDADAFRLAFLDIVESVFEATIEVGEYLIMADVKILTETGQGLISGHDGLLSGAERKKGTAREGPSPFQFQTFVNVCFSRPATAR
jgi:hypothetical protein